MSRIFACDVCHDEILAEKPRIRCQICPVYDLCANCFVCGKCSRQHETSHETVLFEMSGYMPRPPPMPPRPPVPQRPPMTPRPSTTPMLGVQRRPVSMQVPASSYTTVTPPQATNSPQPSATSYPPPPQATHSPQPSATSYPPPPQATNSPQSSAATYPPPPSVSPESPEQPTYQQSRSPGPSPQASYPPPPDYTSGTTPGGPPPASVPPPPAAVPPPPASEPPSGSWQPLFNGSSHTAFGLCFFNELFTRLDPTRTGLLRPEQYSAFIDVLSCGPDVWKAQMAKPVFGYTREDLADYELTQVYVSYSVDHRLAPRNQPRNTDHQNFAAGLSGIAGSLFASIAQAGGGPAPISGGMMPMLTRQGLVDISVFLFARDPSPGWNYVKLACRHYGIWREWGVCPRDCMPAVAPPELVDREKIIQLEARDRAQEVLDAKKIEMNFRKQGREAALELSRDSRYYR